MPHEETWIPEEGIVMHDRYDGQKEAREVLGSAAPEMARALLALLPFHAIVTTRAEAEAVTAALDVLRRAGVPCP